MTIEDYWKGIKELNDKVYKEKCRLVKKYCESNIKYKINDIISDHYKTIQIKKYCFNVDYNWNPITNYIGVRLTKTGKKFKDQSNNIIYECNIKE